MTGRRLIVTGVLVVLALTAIVTVRHAQAQAGSSPFTVEGTTFESNYPRGMTFTITADSNAGDITRATLFYRFRSGLRERENAALDPETGAWVARPYSLRGGLPPWVDFNYWWGLTDAAGNTFETEPQYAVYEDKTRDWWHVDTPDLTLYWFGDMPDLGEATAQAMAEMRPFFEEGWGRTLSYKPLAILFPPGNIWDEYVEGGNNPNSAGFTSPSEGFTIQRIPSLRDPVVHEERRDMCGGYWYGERENTPEEWRLQDMVHTVVHEITHLYQSDFRESGPIYWTEGQADYFAAMSGWQNRYAEGRMRAYGAAGYDLSTLQGGTFAGGSTNAADGCRAIGYAVGETFIRFITDNFGGLATHRAILEAMPGRGLEGAIEAVTGMPFVDVENAYRAHYGIATVEPLPTATPFVIPTAPVFTFPTAVPSTGS